MKITLEFSEYDIRAMIVEHLAKKGLIPQGMTSTINFKLDEKLQHIVAGVAIATPEPSHGDYRGR